MLDLAAIRNDLLRLRNRLRGLFVRYGAGKTAAVAAAAIAVLFALDRWLSLPASVRVVLTLLTIGVVARMLWRDLLAPLRRPIEVRDLALQVEKHHPDLDGRLISVLELDGDALDASRNVSVELVDELRQETERRLRSVRFDAILDPKPAWRMVAAAVVLVSVVVGYGLAHPQLASIFARRVFGGDARWPQRTQLRIAFPETATHFVVESEGDRPVRVKLARGASLPITVSVDGDDPEFVELVPTSGLGAVPLVRSGEREWTGRFRAVRDDFTFVARGGDDDGSDRAIDVAVYSAPTVSAVEATLDFPAYTGLARRIDPRGDLEAPIGTRVTLNVTTSEPVATALLVFENEKGQIALEPASTDAQPAPTNGRLTGSFVVTESTSYSLHLTGTNGFKNLEPATYAVVAIKDRAPVVRLLEPQLADLNVVQNGIVPFRVAADDDFGVAALTLVLTPHGATTPVEVDLAQDAQDPASRQRLLTFSLLDLNAMQFPSEGAARKVQVNDSFTYSVAAVDNKTEADGTGSGNRVDVKDRRIDVVSESELLRELTERQIRRKDEVKQLRALAAEKIERLRGVIDDFAASDAAAKPEATDLAALEVGQNQVTNRALRLCGEFADLFDSFAFNRLDGAAGAERLLQQLVAAKRASVVLDGVDVAVYRPIVDQWVSGAYGQLDDLGRLIEMLSAILDVGERLSPQAASSINVARLTTDDAVRPVELKKALAAEEAALARIDQLLEKMDEWEDYQEIVTLFRDLLDDQRDLNAKTRSVLKGDENDRK